MDMHILLKSIDDFNALTQDLRRGTYKPDSYPCLAVGFWSNVGSVNGGGDIDYVYLYDFVYLKKIDNGLYAITNYDEYE